MRWPCGGQGAVTICVGISISLHKLMTLFVFRKTGSDPMQSKWPVPPASTLVTLLCALEYVLYLCATPPIDMLFILY